MNVAQFSKEYNNIYKCIASDKELRELLGIKNDLDVPEVIIRTQFSPKVINGDLVVRVYQTTPRMARNDKTFWDSFEVKVSGAISYREKIVKIMDRIINLLTNMWVNNRRIEFVTIMGDEFSPTEIHEVGGRFRFINFV